MKPQYITVRQIAELETEQKCLFEMNVRKMLRRIAEARIKEELGIEENERTEQCQT
jgi:hypothetical protein